MRYKFSAGAVKVDETKERNNFGPLRLLLATMVVLSHSAELVDGNPNRELLYALFGTVTSGGVGVLGFFVISGYLISKSFDKRRSPSGTDYLLNRVLRIYPAYLVAYVVSVVIFVPLAGHSLTEASTSWLLQQPLRMLLLWVPEFPNVFSELHYKDLNGPIYTIAYEFRCYLLVIIIGLGGLFAGRLRLIVLVGLALALACTLKGYWGSHGPTFLVTVGDPVAVFRFGAAFLFGICLYVYRDTIPVTGALALASLVALCVCFLSARTTAPGMIIFGGYVIFWLALKAPVLPWPRSDYSYGLYLYAWPIQNLLILYWRDIPPSTLFIITMVFAMCFAWLSWNLVEKPALTFKAKHRASIGPIRRAPAGAGLA